MKTIIFWRLRYALILVWVVILSGCLSPPPSFPARPFSCSSFTESLWEEFRFGVDSPDDVVSTVARLWGIEREQIQVNLLSSGDEVWNVKWHSNATVGMFGDYLTWYQEDQKLGKISVMWGNPRPTFSQTIDCLGFPDHYIAFYDVSGEAEYLHLALLYADNGMIVRHDAPSWSTELPAIHPDMRMDRFVVVPPGTAERVATDMYSYGYEVRYHVRSVCLLKPWPGSIDAMEIASDDEKIRCGVFP